MDQKAPFFVQLTELAAIKATLLKQPTELHGARLAVADADRDVATAKRRVKELEGELADELTEISALVTGNPELKNETQRKAKAAELAKTRPAVATLKAQIAAAEDEVTRAQMAKTQADLRVKLLEDQQRAWRSHLDATQAEVQLLVAGR